MQEFYNADCMEVMKKYPDKFFDLAIVDPVFGDVTQGGYMLGKGGENKAKRIDYNLALWEQPKTNKEYFDELFRVSKHQIIWGGNYFELPSARCFIVWRKTNIPEKFSMSMCEYAWTSFNGNAKVYDHTALRDDSSGKFHPTEKPIALYEWLLSNYANKGDKILDTHVGSASSLIACYNLGFDYVGCEIDETYYKQANERLEEVKKQIRMF